MFFPEYDLIIPEIYEYLIILFGGLVLGSFTTAVAYRVPRGIPWAFQQKRKPQTDQGDGDKDDLSAYRSACPVCKNALGFSDLVPVFSWLFLRGKCQSCKTPIPVRYPLIELGVFLSLCVAYAVYGFTMPLLFIALAIPFLWALFVIDLEYLILPNQLVAILGAIGLLRLGWLYAYEPGFEQYEALEYLLAAIFFAGFIWLLGTIMSKILKKDSLGFGDVKFFAVAGLWHGIESLAFFAFFSGVFGVVFALIWRWKTKEEVFPFGPALIFTFFVLLLFDPSQFFLMH